MLLLSYLNIAEIEIFKKKKKKNKMRFIYITPIDIYEYVKNI